MKTYSKLLLVFLGLMAGQLHAQIKVYNSLEEALEHADSVEYLEIDHLEDEDQLKVLTQFPRLKSLKLSNYHGTEAPEFLSSLTQLSELQFVNDDIVSLPQSYSKLVNLEKIEFLYDTHLDLQQTMEVLNQLPKLKELRIEGLANSTSLDSIHFPDNLKVLSLRNNHLRSFPTGILDIEQLEVLDIGDNYFNQLPKSLSAMKSLNTVFLDQQPLLQFNQTLETLNKSSCLRSVYLGGNHLSPNNLSSLSQKHSYEAIFDDSSILLNTHYKPHIDWLVPFQTDMDHLNGETSIKVNINKR